MVVLHRAAEVHRRVADIGSDVGLEAVAVRRRDRRPFAVEKQAVVDPVAEVVAHHGSHLPPARRAVVRGAGYQEPVDQLRRLLLPRVTGRPRAIPVQRSVERRLARLRLHHPVGYAHNASGASKDVRPEPGGRIGFEREPGVDVGPGARYRKVELRVHGAVEVRAKAVPGQRVRPFQPLVHGGLLARQASLLELRQFEHADLFLALG